MAESDDFSNKIHEIDSTFDYLVDVFKNVKLEEDILDQPKAPLPRSKSSERSGSKFRRPRNKISHENKSASGDNTLTSSKELVPNDPDSKKSIKNWTREWIWHFLESEDSSLYKFPRPIFGKVPHFLNTKGAARLLAGLREFHNAKIIKVDSSMCLMPLRELVLRKKEVLYSNVRDLHYKDFLYCIESKDLKSGSDFGIASTKKGLLKYGKPLRIGLKNPIQKIDMLVVGSVAVCRNGVRLGTGKGLSDIEWGILYDIGAVDKKTIIVTLVADDQVVDDKLLPVWVRDEHDLPVDIIVTPTRVLDVGQKLKRPDCGIIPSLLANETIDKIPCLSIYNF